MRSDPNVGIGRAFRARGRSSTMAAILSPTATRARMSVRQVCGAPSARLQVFCSDAMQAACAAPPSRRASGHMVCVSAATAISATAGGAGRR
jgi:hypothetical protein